MDPWSTPCTRCRLDRRQLHRWPVRQPLRRCHRCLALVDAGSSVRPVLVRCSLPRRNNTSPRSVLDRDVRPDTRAPDPDPHICGKCASPFPYGQHGRIRPRCSVRLLGGRLSLDPRFRSTCSYPRSRFFQRTWSALDRTSRVNEWPSSRRLAQTGRCRGTATTRLSVFAKCQHRSMSMASGAPTRSPDQSLCRSERCRERTRKRQGEPQ